MFIVVGMNLEFYSKTMRRMSCLEILEIRVSQHRQEDFQQELEKTMKETMEEKNVYTIQSYSRGSAGTDYLLIIHHRERIEDHRGSGIGQILIDAFALYGMIHHSIWYEWNKLSTEI